MGVQAQVLGGAAMRNGTVYARFLYCRPIRTIAAGSVL
jgi:hypothetical protein